MGISPDGGRDGRGGTTGGGDLHILPPEHSCTVYCDQDHYGPVSGGGAEARVKGDQAVVGAGLIGCGGDADGGLGGRTDGGGGGDGRRRRRINNKLVGVSYSTSNLRDETECYPCLCSGIGTPPPDYDYSWGAW